MQLIVINLARAPERRLKMEQQAVALGLTFDFMTATDGRELTDADRALVDHERRKSITPYPLADAEIGCWVSHRRAMQQIISSGAPMAAVIEDDAALSPEFPAVLKAIETCGRPFDFIDLHRNFRRCEIFLPVMPLTQDNQLGRVGYTHMKTTAYVMTREGAVKFLAFAPRFAHAVDKEMHRYWANGLDAYGLEKPVAVQDDGGHSYIEETRAQHCPSSRPHYPDACQLNWKIKRRWVQIKDSVLKRMAFKRLKDELRNAPQNEA